MINGIIIVGKRESTAPGHLSSHLHYSHLHCHHYHLHRHRHYHHYHPKAHDDLSAGKSKNSDTSELFEMNLLAQAFSYHLLFGNLCCHRHPCNSQRYHHDDDDQVLAVGGVSLEEGSSIAGAICGL